MQIRKGSTTFTRNTLSALFGFSVILALAGWSLKVEATDSSNLPRIIHKVEIRNPQTQLLNVTTQALYLEDEPWIDLELPVWRPGKYLILDKAGLVQDESATDETGTPLPIRKISKNVWRIDRSKSSGTEVWFSYRMYADSLGDRTLYLDEEHAFLSGSAVFMNYMPRRNEPVGVMINAPAGWQVATGLEQIDSGQTLWVAPNYDILVDSPIEVGIHQKVTFKVQDKLHEVIVWGDVLVEFDTLRWDLSVIVEECATIWGDLPYDRYVFLIHAAPGLGGGTEHWNSTIMQVGPEALSDPNQYETRFLPLVAHEFFHTWNVKRLRPAGLVPYDYSKENYTSLLWVSEGTTSYFEEILLVRNGLMTVETALDNWSSAIHHLFEMPGDKVQSLAESSFDSWIKFNQRHAHSSNVSVNFYHKGALVSLALDLEIRRLTNGANHLESVLRQLYQEYPLEKGGFSESDFKEKLLSVAPYDWDGFWNRYIDGHERIPFEVLLRTIGLELVFLPNDHVQDPMPFQNNQSNFPRSAYWGLNMSGVTVRSVMSDGPCFHAGVHPGDEILAIDGKRFHSGDLEDEDRGWKPGQSVDLTYFRGERLRTQTIRLGSQLDGVWNVRQSQCANQEQKEEFESLLRKPFDSNASTAND